jgi:hypothetical protein
MFISFLLLQVVVVVSVLGVTLALPANTDANIASAGEFYSNLQFVSFSHH